MKALLPTLTMSREVLRQMHRYCIRADWMRRKSGLLVQYHTASHHGTSQIPLQTLSIKYSGSMFHTGIDTRGAKGPQMHETQTTDDAHKLLVIQPEFKSGPVEKPYVPAALKLEEAVALVEAISGWEVKYQRIEAIREVHNKYLFGTGKIKELKSDVRSLRKSVTGVFINTPTLTPLQHRCLAAIFKSEVFDRFGIVLRIFKERAHTKEAKLQVQLAEIPYLRGKLSDGTEGHQRGAAGRMGGGGETSVMAMKASLSRRQKRIRTELDDIRSRQKAEREHRARHTGLPIVAVVGYTNTGKTTLIRTLTLDDSLSPEDKLFATLDSTVHAGRLPCGLKVLFVDTIGFISDLPHELVESFVSTLEDVINADVLVSVTDVCHPQSYAQRANVLKVLSQLNPRQRLLDDMVEVFNKADMLTMPDSSPDRLLISATSGNGIPELQERIETAVLSATHQKRWRIIVPANGAQLSWLHHTQQATVLDVKLQEGLEDMFEVAAILSDTVASKFRAKFGNLVQLHTHG